MASSKHEVAKLIKSLERDDETLWYDDIIEAARPEDSPIHNRFTWDIAVAAQERWRDQARALVRSVKVTQEWHEVVITSVRYIRNPEAPPRVMSYRAVTAIAQNDAMAREALAREYEAIQDRLRTRARPLAVALGLADEHTNLERMMTVTLARLIEDIRSKAAESAA